MRVSMRSADEQKTGQMCETGEKPRNPLDEIFADPVALILALLTLLPWAIIAIAGIFMGLRALFNALW